MSHPEKVYWDGTPLRAEPINMNTTTLLHRLFVVRQPVKVELEPGDATRYTLVIVPDQGAFHVLRLTGGDELKGALVYSLQDLHDKIPMIAGGNEWTRTLLWWWLAFVLFPDAAEARNGSTWLVRTLTEADRITP